MFQWKRVKIQHINLLFDVCFTENSTKLSSTAAKKSRPKHLSNIVWLKILHDLNCFLLIVNVLLFIAFNNMEALDIPQESLLAMVIRYGLYVGAIFQMICLGAVIFMVPRNSSKSLTAGAIWSFLKVTFFLSVSFALNFQHQFHSDEDISLFSSDFDCFVVVFVIG